MALQEFPRLRQESTGHRRLFCDEDFDLYVWYDAPGGQLFGFQLVYGDGDGKNALTWTVAEGLSHHGVDGWDSRRFNETPVLVATEPPDLAALRTRLEPRLAEVDPEIRSLVLKTLG